MEPLTFWFSNSTLSLFFKASSLEIWITVSFVSILGVSVFFSTFFFYSRFWFTGGLSGIKNKEYKTITADDNAIAAITFFESIIF